MKTLLSVLAAAVLMSTAAMAADSTDAKKMADKPMATSTSKPKPVQSEKSKKCSAEADAKKLHGKARKAFRKECLKAA